MAEGNLKKRKIDHDGDVDTSAKKQRTPGASTRLVDTTEFLGAVGHSLVPSLASLFADSAGRTVNEALLSKKIKKTINGGNKETSTRSKQRKKPEAGASPPPENSIVENAEAKTESEATTSVAPAGHSEWSTSEVEDRDPLDHARSPDQPDVESLHKGKRRKKPFVEDDLEAKYLQKLARESRRMSTDPKKPPSAAHVTDDAVITNVGNGDEVHDADVTDDDEGYVPPTHESLTPQSNAELEKAQSTVFLGNVAVDAVRSKSARKALETHLKSFFSTTSESDDKSPKASLISLRFRSTPFASAIPKRAAFARGEIMDATALSTNAYAVYSSPLTAREAVRRLNGTMVLERHLRVDSVAHPAKVDHHRCVFVGNLGFVEDETNIDAADEETGRQKRKGKKQPSDTEEGLWRTFGKCGTVESVRVVRDAKTRVGKGIAYVQFIDENAVEAALLLNEKKFPPMLPRKLRVMRAKAQKRNKSFAAGDRAERQGVPTRKGGYVPKRTPEERSQMGRAAKLFGKAGARAARRSDGGIPTRSAADGTAFRDPESFVFEGNRAKFGAGTDGVKLKKGFKKRMPTKSSSKRAAAFKTKGKQA